MAISLCDDAALRWPSYEDHSARLSLPSKQRVAGSNPAGRTILTRQNVCYEKVQEVFLLLRAFPRVTIEDPGWRGLDTLFSAPSTLGQAAILQPPKPSIAPSARILERAAEHDVEPEAGG